ncbi:hypothetical protein SAMN05216378_1804 [Paenibacillus catalpae]|uniref:Uncharacterized protein n=1 Tax=Paenibacillus catalpae TaxID=1045775 RepID=A0A1I1WQ30_9BACL|nr:hypothetical protein [Paenibacillus catalpae]SFD97071.1 hypothetical protein SAMN05216378_1804 [Paenibacillus catalpae]
MRNRGIWIGGVVSLLLLAGCGNSADNEPKPTPTPVVTDSAETTAPGTETPEAQPSETPDGTAIVDLKLNRLDNVFGFAGETGEQLITIPIDSGTELNNPEQFDTAVGNGGELIEIEFVRHQEANDQDTNRQTINNFNNMDGYIYKVKEGTLLSNKSYMLARKGVVSKGSLMELTSTEDGQYSQADADTIARIEALKKRKVTASSILSESAKEKIALFVFEREGDEMLASLAYVSGEKVLFKDFPATYNESGTWRVDGGDDPGRFEVLFLAHSDEGLLLGIAWAGAEGENLFVLQEEEGALQDTNLLSNRYWAP